jgi:hypothetical protein
MRISSLRVKATPESRGSWKPVLSPNDELTSERQLERKRVELAECCS